MMRTNLGKVRLRAKHEVHQRLEAMERGERIDSLLDKTSALKAESVRSTETITDTYYIYYVWFFGFSERI